MHNEANSSCHRSQKSAEIERYTRAADQERLAHEALAKLERRRTERELKAANQDPSGRPKLANLVEFKEQLKWDGAPWGFEPLFPA